jgi:hypothetical protein
MKFIHKGWLKTWFRLYICRSQYSNMQPKLLLTCFLLISVISNAQMVKGTRMVGATVASSLFSSGTTDVTGPNQLAVEQSNKNFNLQLTPSMGWFVSENTVVGASLLVGVNNQSATNKSAGVSYKEDKSKNLDAGLGGFARVYLRSTGSLRPFAHLHFTAGSGSTDTEGYYYYTDGTNTVKDTYDGSSKGRFFYNAGLNAGFTRMLNQNAGLDLYIGYLYSYTRRTTNTTMISDNSNNSLDTRFEFENTQKYTGHGVTFGIGYQIFLGKK